MLSVLIVVRVALVCWSVGRSVGRSVNLLTYSLTYFVSLRLFSITYLVFVRSFVRLFSNLLWVILRRCKLINWQIFHVINALQCRSFCEWVPTVYYLLTACLVAPSVLKNTNYLLVSSLLAERPLTVHYINHIFGVLTSYDWKYRRKAWSLFLNGIILTIFAVSWTISDMPPISSVIFTQDDDDNNYWVTWHVIAYEP